MIIYFTCFSLQVTLMQRLIKSTSAKALRACSRFAVPSMLPGKSAPCIDMCKFGRPCSSDDLRGVKRRLKSVLRRCRDC